MKFTTVLAVVASLSAVALGDCPADDWDNTLWNPTPNGALGTGTCKSGYYADFGATPQRQCNLDGTWQTTPAPNPRCLAVLRCLSENIDDLFLTFPSTIPPKDDVTASCFTGYRYTGTGGARKRDCLQDFDTGDGYWDTEITGGQVCTRNTCPQETSGNALWSLTNSLETANGVCNEGFSGAPTRFCGPAHNTWGSINNACTRNQCPAETVDGNTFPVTDSLSNDVAGTCAAGYSLTGGNPPTRDCGATTWVDGSITNACTRNICEAESFEGTNWDQTNSLESDTKPCPAGFTGNRVRPCNAAGTWGAINDSGCTPAPGQCPETDWDHTHWEATSGPGWSSGTCHPGFGSASIPERWCLDSGSWSGNRVRNRCLTLYCETEDSTIQGETVSWPTSKALRTPKIRCPSGQGYATRHCSAAGSWDSVQGDCLPDE